MSKYITIIIFLICSNLIIAQKQVPIDSVSLYVGQTVKICDKVSDAFKPNGDNKLTYINFGGKYPDHKITVVIFPADLGNFPFLPSDHYKNQNVCVTGMATEYKGKPQIVAKFPDQIDIQ